MWRPLNVIRSVLIVVAGTASTITSKLQYEVRSKGFDKCKYHDDDGHADDDMTRRECLFTKPWFQTLVMKVAMSTCLFLTYASQWRLERLEKAKARERSVNGDDLAPGSWRHQQKERAAGMRGRGAVTITRSARGTIGRR